MGGEEAINSAARLISVSFLVTKFAEFLNLQKPG